MTQLPYDTLPIPNDWDRGGLAGWTYHSRAPFALERERLFLTHWQVAGHVCDTPNPADWLAFDLMGERAVIMRGADGGAGLPQPLPASRRAGGGRRAGPLQGGHRLSVPWLGLQS